MVRSVLPKNTRSVRLCFVGAGIGIRNACYVVLCVGYKFLFVHYVNGALNSDSDFETFMIRKVYLFPDRKLSEQLQASAKMNGTKNVLTICDV